MKKVKLATATLALLAGTVVAPVYSTTAQAVEATKTSESVKDEKEVKKDEVQAPTETSKETVETPEVPKADASKEVNAPKEATQKAEKTEAEKALEAAKADALEEIAARVASGMLDGWESVGLENDVNAATTVDAVYAVLGKKAPEKPKPAEKTELEKAKDEALEEIAARVAYGVIDENEAWGMEVAVKDAKTIEQVNAALGKKTPEKPKPVEKTELEKAKEKALADVKTQLEMDYLTQEQANSLDLAITAATSVEEINKLMNYQPTEPTTPEVNKELEKLKDQAFAELKKWFEEDLVTYEETWELTAKINDAKSLDELKALGFLTGETTTPEVDKALENAKDLAFAELKEWFENDLVSHEEAWELTAKINDAKSFEELRALGFLGNLETNEKESTVTVNYVDEAGKEIKASESKQAKVGEKQTFKAAEIKGYEVVGNGLFEATFTDSPQTITFTYKAVEEKDVYLETGKDIAFAELKEWFENGLVTYEEAWELTAKINDAKSIDELRALGFKVEFEAAAKESTVTVKYVDKAGKEIKESESLTKDIGETHTFDAANIAGYVVDGPASINVEFKDSPQTITFTYNEEAKETQSTVTVKHVDKAGKEIKESESLTKDIGETHTFNAANIVGYVVDGPASIDVEFKDSPQTITFTYDEEAKETQSTVTVKHVDKAGKEIKESESLTKDIGETHTFNAANIAGYVVDGPASIDVEFKDGGQTITFAYDKVEEAKVTESTVTVKYVDKDGKELIKSNSLTAKIGDVYEFFAAEIEGYKLVSPASIVLTFTDSPQTVSFTYEKVEGKKVIDDKKGNKKDPKKIENKATKATKTDKKATLPQTGEAASAGLLAGGFMSMLTAAFVFFRKNK
ncbi:MucBP domain-containing protein [Vagococcus fluvialis]|uniref:Internalin-like protein (LPXTG motif) Lmo2396 homolog n=1 Tax=Vagococcus fluvialis bH819 TaxID=1255619 RepID=A0A1X6WMK9_9ENTE|nr:MucBP domain-containing protein [Vagococcus fluvialis]SLM85488.1 Internalin-like protein (LPXTG motif) Lmo2396 homolog [Vagococcus fluvialis bH819]